MKDTKPYGYAIEEYDSQGVLVWSSLMLTRPKELSWFKDLPTKKHTLVIKELYVDESKTETFNGIKSYKESTKRLIEANNGL